MTYSVGGEQSGSIAYCVSDGELQLDYSLNGEPRHQRISIVRTPCNYGGMRQWFACPHCRRRCEVLYCRRGGFCCRKCAQVAYASQSEDFVGRTWRVQQKAEARLEPDGTRPKGMHRKTYERLLSVVERAEEARDLSLMAFIARHF